MPPPSKKKDGPSGVWYKLLIVSALLLAFGQLMLHHAQPSSVPAYSSSPKANLIPDEGGALMGPGTDATAGLLQANSALQASLDETKAALRESQGRVQEMGEAARALRVQAETTARAGREKVEPRVQKQDPAVVHAIPTVAVNWPNVGAAALEVAMARADSQGGNGTSKPLLLDDTYTLRPEDCGIILSQRKRVAAMDEDFAFVKYDRGKVAFNKEWSVCDTKQSSVDLVHCLDQWLLRHCRANVLTNAAAALRIGLNPDGGGGAGGSGSSDPAGWAAWVAEVAGAYPALGLVLGVPPSMPPPRSAAGPQRISGVGGGRYFFLAACLHNNAPLLKSGYVENLVALARHLRATGGRAAGAAVGGWPRNRVFVSIYENDSTDGTGKELERLRGALTGAGVEHAVVSEKRGAAVEPDRIDKLSFARGRALAPLLAQHAAGTDNAAGVTGGGGDGGYDGDGGGDDDDDDDGDGRWVVFLNDIGFHWQDVAELVATPVAYDMACGMDFQAGEGVELYDVWVNRDLDGKPVARQAPHFSHPLDKDLLNRGLPVPVSCCWNGAVVVRAKVSVSYQTTQGLLTLTPHSACAGANLGAVSPPLSFDQCHAPIPPIWRPAGFHRPRPAPGLGGLRCGNRVGRCGPGGVPARGESGGRILRRVRVHDLLPGPVGPWPRAHLRQPQVSRRTRWRTRLSLRVRSELGSYARLIPPRSLPAGCGGATRTVRAAQCHRPAAPPRSPPQCPATPLPKGSPSTRPGPPPGPPSPPAAVARAVARAVALAVAQEALAVAQALAATAARRRWC